MSWRVRYAPSSQRTPVCSKAGQFGLRSTRAAAGATHGSFGGHQAPRTLPEQLIPPVGDSDCSMATSMCGGCGSSREDRVWWTRRAHIARNCLMSSGSPRQVGVAILALTAGARADETLAVYSLHGESGDAGIGSRCRGTRDGG
eukprot:scaffold15134_cov101-Isochrysis_galbana.AAC.4